VEGSKLAQVASDNDAKVETKVSQQQQARRVQHEPILLLHRDNTPVQEPSTPPAGTSPH
jgi:hypothetical protein